MKHKPSLLIVSGPSGCGKDTVIERVCQRMEGVGMAVSCTTRKPRPKGDGNEQHGIDYFFMKPSEFEEHIRQRDFLEFTDNNGDLYGTLRSQVERMQNEGKDIVILNIDNQGAAQIMAIEPAAVSVFLLPPDAQELKRRLICRKSETPEQVEKRMKKSLEQLRMAYIYDYVVVNDSLDIAVEALVHIICAVRRRTLLNKSLIDQIIVSFE